MFSILRRSGAVAGCVMVVAGCAGMQSAQPGPENMTFFVTSTSPGKGADLGGIDGADKHCQTLAEAAGAGKRTWRAYLSTQAPALSDPKFVNAQGVVVARNVDELHSPANKITKETALDEKGQPVNGRTEKPNNHDILTGSRPDGTAFPGAPFYDMTCGNWTKSGTDGSAMTGHHDRAGPIESPWASSWNSSHPTRGCDPDGIQSTGGAGLFYCFAEK